MFQICWPMICQWCSPIETAYCWAKDSCVASSKHKRLLDTILIREDILLKKLKLMGCLLTNTCSAESENFLTMARIFFGKGSQDERCWARSPQWLTYCKSLVNIISTALRLLFWLTRHREQWKQPGFAWLDLSNHPPFLQYDTRNGCDRCVNDDECCQETPEALGIVYRGCCFAELPSKLSNSDANVNRHYSEH